MMEKRILARVAWWMSAVLAVAVLSGCAATQPYVAESLADWRAVPLPPASERVYQVFLIGDTGDPGRDTEIEPALTLLDRQLAAADPQSAVVFLGDNIYCCGLADSLHPRRAQDERRLLAQLQIVEDYPGRIVFIPGNHDWNDGQDGGREAVERQEAYVETYLGRGDVFVPSDGFPGPVEIDLTDRLRLIAVDTQWWLHPFDKSYGETDGYDLEEDADFLLELDDLIQRRDDEDLLIVGHHPLFSRSVHGGFFTWEDHLFPLTDVASNAYLPLPGLGSLYPLAAQFVGSRQDFSNPRNRMLRSGLLGAFQGHERLVYAAGHDHSLQYFAEKNLSEEQHFLVSGAGSRPGIVGRGGGATFTAGTPGYAVLHYYADGQLWLEMWGATGADGDGEVLFRTRLLDAAPELVDPEVPTATDGLPDYRDSTVVAPVNPTYDAASGLKRTLLGSHHRWAWGTPVEAPVLDLAREKGGLTPIKRGGGQQTTSLRLQGGDGEEYVLRTLDKDPSGTVPEALQGTIATDIVQDQIASLHPFGAFIIPSLAEAAGIYHTRPRLVYVPDDPRLGIYREQFADRLMMLEERPDDDERHAPHFGASEDVIGANKLYREIDGDNDHRVDQHAFVRNRLFDMWIADWDRHRDQWRWASFEPYELDSTLTGEARTQGKIYRPVPRDRDWAFNRMNGLFPSLAPYFDPKFQDFEEAYGNLKGLTLNGLPQDRRFLNALTREDWIATAEDLQRRLTDAVIEEAVRRWPEPVFEQDGARTIRLLKQRRDQLREVAEATYAMHARVVDVVGSDKHERFEVRRLTDDSTEVVVYKTSKEGAVRKMLYRRTFLRGETEEVRLYGLGGNDTFDLDGAVRRGVRVRAIGGAGADAFSDRSHVAGLGKKTVLYDTETGQNAWAPGRETRVVRRDDPAVNAYRPELFKHDALLPQVFFGSNDDDGVFLGGGVKRIVHGFRKVPYARTHRLVANVATRTQAFNIVYAGHYVDVLHGWDATLDLSYLSPDNIRNFYGLGNETEDVEDDRTFYQARLTRATAAPALVRHVEGGLAVRIGTGAQFIRVREDEDRFIGQVQEGISENTFENQWFALASAGLALDRTDDPVNPMLGVRWTGDAVLHAGFRNATDTYGTLSSRLAAYVSPSTSPQVTLALRVGAAHNVGAFPFFGANTLGARDNLRGYRSTRFAGRTSTYQNAELRMALFDFSTYLAIGTFGVLGFVDNGRVWTDGETSDVWHQGYGGGIWATVFDAFALTGTLGVSPEELTFTLKLGFLY
ncbi:MAG: BamA/TamA family outer membrane protein [Bacteroidetes bacterium]|jgi:hypothetical protein|nr:BamA/TamA family outer membrane protein [Bacteroidota bacterium]